MSKAHSCLPDVLTAVDGVDIFCCVLWGGTRAWTSDGKSELIVLVVSKAVQPLSLATAKKPAEKHSNAQTGPTSSTQGTPDRGSLFFSRS